jgi:hypothetical protein
MTRALLLSLLLSLSACGKKTAESCGPVKVTVDGTEIPGLTHGLAMATKQGGALSFQVQVFNHDKATCEQILSKNGRSIPEGEKSVRAFTGGGMIGDGVGIEAHTQGQLDVTMLTPKPAKDGDVVGLCVGESKFSPEIGDYKGKQIVVKGYFSGPFCGVLDWDAK